MNAPATGTKSKDSRLTQLDNRKVWIVTVYAACGIAFFGVLAYYAANYLAVSH